MVRFELLWRGECAHVYARRVCHGCPSCVCTHSQAGSSGNGDLQIKVRLTCCREARLLSEGGSGMVGVGGAFWCLSAEPAMALRPGAPHTPARPTSELKGSQAGRLGASPDGIPQSGLLQPWLERLPWPKDWTGGGFSRPNAKCGSSGVGHRAQS